MLKKENT